MAFALTSVPKVLIKGIRSFAPDNDYIIEFYRPLTIIVGSNGAGKTVRGVVGVCFRGFALVGCSTSEAGVPPDMGPGGSGTGSLSIRTP